MLWVLKNRCCRRRQKSSWRRSERYALEFPPKSKASVLRPELAKTGMECTLSALESIVASVHNSKRLQESKDNQFAF